MAGCARCADGADLLWLVQLLASGEGHLSRERQSHAASRYHLAAMTYATVAHVLYTFARLWYIYVVVVTQ
jgi:hypothetical protein